MRRLGTSPSLFLTPWSVFLLLFLLFFLTTGHIHRAETALIRGLKLAVEARDEETRAMIESDLIKLDINIQWKVWFNLSASWMFYSCFPFTLLLCLLSALLLSNSSPLHFFLFLPVLIFSSSSFISASVHLFPLRIQFALPSPPFLSLSSPLLPFSLFSSLSLFSFVSSLSLSLLILFFRLLPCSPPSSPPFLPFSLVLSSKPLFT